MGTLSLFLGTQPLRLTDKPACVMNGSAVMDFALCPHDSTLLAAGTPPPPSPSPRCLPSSLFPICAVFGTYIHMCTNGRRVRGQPCARMAYSRERTHRNGDDAAERAEGCVLSRYLLSAPKARPIIRELRLQHLSTALQATT